MGGNCAIIPRYQRAYSWDVVRGHSLVQDIAHAAARPDGDPDHWIGVLIYETLRDPELQCDEGKNDPNNHYCREIVDGQQRLTTLALWHLALHAHAKSIGEELDSDGKFPLPTLILQKPNDKQLDRIKGGASVEGEEHIMYRVYTYFRLILWLGTDTILADEPCKPLRANAKGTSLEAKFQGHFDTSQRTETPLKRSARVELATLLEATWDRLRLLVVQTGENTEESEGVIL